MGSKVVNRYTIAQVSGELQVRRITSPDYVTGLLGSIQKYNNNSRNIFFIGDVEVNNKERIVTFKKYKKISNPTTLDEIDKCTTYVNSDYDLKEYYGTDKRNNHPFVIVYRSNKRIKTLPIIYRKHAKCLDREYVRARFIRYARSVDFINLILKNRQIESSSRASIDEYDRLFALRESLEHNNPEDVSISPMIKFYSSFITEGTKFNYFNFRLLGIVVKTYEQSQEPEPEEEEEERQEIFGQMMIAEYVMQILREEYEEAKLLITEGSLEEVYRKKMVMGHKTTK